MSFLGTPVRAGGGGGCRVEVWEHVRVNATRVFSSTFGRVLTAAVAVVALLALGSVVATDGLGGALLWAAPCALVPALVWALFWNPRVEVADGGVTVVNVLRTVHVPWPVYRGVEVAWSLVVRADDAAVTAWAAPRSSGTANRTATRRRGGSVQPSEHDGAGRRWENSSAEQVARVIAERHTQLVAAGHLRPVGAPEARATAEGPRTTKRWNVAVLAAVLGLGAATAVCVLLG